jgi:hypothetical protein
MWDSGAPRVVAVRVLVAGARLRRRVGMVKREMEMMPPIHGCHGS